MSAKGKDEREPDSGDTAHGDLAPPDDDETVQSRISGRSDPELIRGKVLEGKYEILSHLGSGAMGAVYKARHAILNKEVAVKILVGAALNDPVKKKRFLREAKAQGGLSHRNIAAVHDVGLTEEEQPFFVMDLLNGESLEEYLQKQKSLTLPEFIAIFEQVARGLHHAHTKGIVHRDIKPSNIMLIHAEDSENSEDGELHAIVVDFGIALLSQEELTKLTKIGYIVGTPHYMSPEQIEAKTLDARSDIYSLGCVMYEALTGNVPFLGMNAAATMALHLAQQPEHITSFKTKSPLPLNISDLVMRCISKDPNQRFASAKEIASQLGGQKQTIATAETDFSPAGDTPDLVISGKDHQSKNPAPQPAVPVEAQEETPDNEIRSSFPDPPSPPKVELKTAGQDIKETEPKPEARISATSDTASKLSDRKLEDKTSSDSSASGERVADTKVLPAQKNKIQTWIDPEPKSSKIIRWVIVGMVALFLVPINGRLAVPPGMKPHDNSFLEGLVYFWNSFTLHMSLKWVVWLLLLMFVYKAIKSFQDRK